jgi:hypothetical protein
VPTYGRGHPLGFHPWAENVHSGLRGVRKGLARVDPGVTRMVGVALFAEWTASAGEWRACRQEWVQPKGEVRLSSWANFASGLFGALVGGLATLLATWLTMREVRKSIPRRSGPKASTQVSKLAF